MDAEPKEDVLMADEPDEVAVSDESKTMAEPATVTSSTSDSVDTATTSSQVTQSAALPEVEQGVGEVAATLSTATTTTVDATTTAIVAAATTATSTAFSSSSSGSAVQAPQESEADAVATTVATSTVVDVHEGGSVAPTQTTATGTVATSSEDLATSADELSSVVVTVEQTTTGLAFSESECTTVDDGSYYCQRTTAVQTDHDDLYAAPDADGDLEIFLRRSGQLTQVTDNLVDDASPHYDANSNTMVWHRLVDDRYQIIAYDVTSGGETVLTNTAVNNMQPSRSGLVTAWQRWVNNNWEIILLLDGQEVQLTDSSAHDIAPSVRGTLVIWNVTLPDGTHTLMTYDTLTKQYNEIKDTQGAAVSNPRMVVVYDATFENGDTVTRGYDLVTGEIIPLQQTPRDLPEELPQPDSTGQTRALATTSVQRTEEPGDDLAPEPVIDPPPTDPDLAVDPVLDLGTSTASTSTDQAAGTATTSAAFELDLRPASTGTPTASSSSDLVIQPMTTTPGSGSTTTASTTGSTQT